MKTGWIPIRLSPDDVQLIRQVGAGRRGAKQASGMRGTRLQEGHQFGTDGQAMGFAAELAVARVLGVEPNTTISVRGSGGVHLLVGRDETAYRINAAYISRPTYDLRFTPGHVPDADIFVLTCGNLKAMWVIGTISRDKFLKLAEFKDFGHGMRLCVAQPRLSPALDLADFFGVGASAREMISAYEREERAAQAGLFDAAMLAG